MTLFDTPHQHDDLSLATAEPWDRQAQAVSLPWSWGAQQTLGKGTTLDPERGDDKDKYKPMSALEPKTWKDKLKEVLLR